MEKVAENGRKVKAIALRFCVCLSLYEKWKKVAENGRKVKVIALLFS
jgi:transposase-like protein